LDAIVVRIDYRKLKPGRPPVLVLGGLGQVWPLGIAQIPIILATDELNNPALASRYICGYCLLPSHREAESAIIPELLAVGRELRRLTGSKPPVFCGNDHDLAFTYEFGDSLAKEYLLLGNGPEVGLSLLEKDRFHTLSVRNGLPVPRMYRWDGNGDDSVIGAESPVIVKPRRKEKWDQTDGFQALFHTKAKIFPNGRALVADPGLTAIKEQIFIQEYIPGNDSEIYSFHGLTDQEGELMEWFLGRKIRTFPKFTGESSFIELIKEEKLFRTGRDIVRRLGLRGVFKMDFKRDARSGRFYLLEINARFTLWHYLGAANGVNIPQAAYEYLVYGIRRKPSPYRTSVKWNHLYLDYHAYRELNALGELTFGKWARSLFARHVQNVFFWKDPMPFLRWAGDYFMQRMHK
jgi:predicted ATP-grasp superfamily ATP-dependent carboligase